MTEYIDLASAIEQAGFYTSFRAHAGPMLVVVSSKDAKGRLCGNSLCLTRHEGCWCVNTWMDDAIYSVPADQDVVSLCVECLKLTNTPIPVLPNDIIAKYGLQSAPVVDPEKR